MHGLSVGLSFEAIGNAIGRDEVWVASAFYGQVGIGYLFPYGICERKM